LLGAGASDDAGHIGGGVSVGLVREEKGIYQGFKILKLERLFRML
jgi:hypothetical protein